MIPIWLEIHLDGEGLSSLVPGRARRRWDVLASALDDTARRAERHGARLTIRSRARFAALDRSGLLRDLVARGHEVGWHAHGDALRAARDAVVAAGGDARYATPGLVQAKDRAKLLAETRALGAEVVTDRVEAPVRAYQGWLAWEPVPGLVSLDVSVSPFDWGVLAREGRTVAPGQLDTLALTRRIAAREQLRVPTGAVGFFGATCHDHDLLDAGARAGLERVFARWGRRIVPAGEVGRAARAAFDAGGALRGGAPPRPRIAITQAARAAGARVVRRLHRARLALERRGAPPSERTLHAGSREFAARRVGPAGADVVLVVVHGGQSGVAQGLAPFGLSEAGLAEEGLAAWTFARSEGLAPPGGQDTVDEVKAVLAAALAEGAPVVLLTWSAGVIPALRAAIELADPRIVALVDVEGPVDRFSLVPPGAVDHPLWQRDLWDDTAWAGLEAAALLPAFHGRYRRAQGEDDHVHGRMPWHAVRMVDAARDGWLNDGKGLLPGRVDDHADALVRWLRADAGR